MATKVSIVDATEGPKQKVATTHNRCYLVTAVYHRQIDKDEPDFEGFKSYLNEKLAEFWSRRAQETLKVWRQELADLGPPKITVECSLEHNDVKKLHHHCLMQMEFPSLRLPTAEGKPGKLETWQLDYGKFYEVFRDVMDFGEYTIPIKLDFKDLGPSNILNVKRYLMKNVA